MRQYPIVVNNEYYLQKTSNGKSQIIFARINQALVLKICIPNNIIQKKLILPDINFILATSFERDYATPRAFATKELIRIKEDVFMDFFGNSIDVIFNKLNRNIHHEKNVQKRA